METLEPEPHPRLSTITFDVGGTLLSPDPSVGAVYAEVFARHGVAAGAREIEAAFQRAWKTVAGETGGPTDEANEIGKWRRLVNATLRDLPQPRHFDSLFEELWHTFSEPRRWRLREHTREVLCELRERGIQLAVLSNWDSRLRPLLKGFGLIRYFETLFISAEIGWEKPDLRIFRAVEDTLSAKPSEILHLGDCPHSDAAPARAAGWRSLLIRDETGTNGVTGPEITDLRELLMLVTGNTNPRPPDPR